MDKHCLYMNRALELSQKALGKTFPNPLVGAVIVKNGKVIAEGYHKKAGNDHAEVIALTKAGKNAKSATLYVTLEPCCTQGKVPPCTGAIIRSGIKKVVIGMIDPNPVHRGRGIKILQKHGIQVAQGILENEIRASIQPFIKYITQRIPYVTVKAAQSIDGKIATFTGDSKWITSKESRQHSRRLRNHFDAILVGATTVLKDNPSLSPDNLDQDKKFYKVILDTKLSIKSSARIFQDGSRFPVIIVTNKETLLRKKAAITPLLKRGTMLLGVNAHAQLIDINDCLKKLALLEISSILVEGGGSVIGSFFDAQAVDAVSFFIAPIIIGGRNATTSVEGHGKKLIAQAMRIKKIKHFFFGGDSMLQGIIKEY